ncbi:isochorismatase [Klebsiella pneumoniae]|nr:isochorismatase [Klebsiella pneumoniae]
MAIPKLQAYALPEASDIPANKVNWAFEPSRAALLIHDMQEYFLNFWGENSAMMEKVVANIAALRDFCKQNGIPVYYTAQPKEQSDEDRALLNDMWGPGLTRSPEQQQVIAALAPDEDDTVLVKWRYSAFHRSPLEEMLKETGRDQLIITGVYAHIGCMTTATDAFMRDIKPFFVADALADFSREEHLMALKYVAGRSGRVVMTEELLPLPASKAALRALILPLLDESDEPMDDENLIDYGLDSVRMMALAARWRKVHGDIDFVMLAKKPDHRRLVGAALPRGAIMAALDFRGQTVWVTGAGKGIGYATALAFVEAGANVTGFDLAFDGESYPFATETLDVADADQVREACSRLLANTERLDVLVNAAGILRMGATDQLSAEDWQQTFAVNVGGAFNLFQQTMAQFPSPAGRGDRHRRLRCRAHAAHRHERLWRLEGGAEKPGADRRP